MHELSKSNHKTCSCKSSVTLYILESWFVYICKEVFNFDYSHIIYSFIIKFQKRRFSYDLEIHKYPTRPVGKRDTKSEEQA